MRTVETLMISDGETSLRDSAKGEKIFLKVKKGVLRQPPSIGGVLSTRAGKSWNHTETQQQNKQSEHYHQTPIIFAKRERKDGSFGVDFFVKMPYTRK
jgi:hypothetical protein